MPLHSIHTLRAGSTGRSVLVFVTETGSGHARTGLTSDAPGAVAAAYREGAERAERIALVRGRVGAHIPGGFSEVDPMLLPGLYQLDVPDAVLAPGSPRAIVLLRFDDAAAEPVELDLVAYDPQDSRCIGMTQLSDERRHQFLRQALPRMTEMELALGVEAERELAERAGE